MNRNELINYIILNSKISLEDIAQNIGVNRSNIYLWRTNKTKPKIEYVNKMANLAGITLKWINQNEIIIDNIDSDNVEMKNDSSKEKIISLQDETIKLQKEKISVLEKRLSNREATPSNFEMELDYHFEMNGIIESWRSDKLVRRDIRRHERRLYHEYIRSGDRILCLGKKTFCIENKYNGGSGDWRYKHGRYW